MTTQIKEFKVFSDFSQDQKKSESHPPVECGAAWGGQLMDDGGSSLADIVLELNMWWDEAGHVWMHLSANPSRWYLLQNSAVYWVERWLVRLSVLGESLPVVVQRRCQGGVAEHAFFFMRQSTVASWRISCISCSRGSHLEIWSFLSSRRRIWQFMFCLGVA